ncbi:unnamed protein product [Mucor hiemalis]
MTHGVIYGIGSSIMFYIALSVVPLWFVKNRGAALGILSSGISIGGLVMPLIIEPLNTNLGAPWCYRVLSLICFVAGVLSCLIFKNKEKPEISIEQKTEMVMNSNDASKLETIKSMFDFSVAKDWRFLLWCASDIFMEAAYNVPNYFIPSYATYLGLSTSKGALILSVCSGMNALGRIVSGFAADYFGHINTIILYSIITGVASLTLWVYAKSFEILMAYAIVFGFFGGAFITLIPTITLLTTGQERFESGLSVFLIITVLSMFGPNVAGAIEGISGEAHPFDSYKYFTAAGYLTGAASLFILKISFNRSPFAKI